MADCNCKLCREGYGGIVNDLPDQGFNRDEIQQWIKDNLGFTISKSTLSKHFESNEIDLDTDSRSEFGGVRVIDLKAELDKSCVEKWITNPDEYKILNKLQIAHLDLHFMLIVRAKLLLESWFDGTSKIFPSACIRDLESSLNMLNKVSGLETTVSDRKAVDRVKAMGYRVEADLLSHILPDPNKQAED